MNITLFIIGVIITLITIYDMIATIFSPRGASFMADKISRGIWRFSFKIAKKDGGNKLLNTVGLSLLHIIVLSFIIIF